MATLDETGVPYRVVEIDQTDEPIEALNRGYGYLASL